MKKTLKNKNQKRRSLRFRKNGLHKNTNKLKGGEGEAFAFVKNLFGKSNSPQVDSKQKAFLFETVTDKDYAESSFRTIIPTNVAFYQIYGLGCDLFIERNLEQAQKYESSYLKQIQSSIASAIKANDEDVHIICNHKLDPIYNIVAIWTGRKLSADILLTELSNLENTKEFKSVIEDVKRDIGLGKNVFINAHSFGGAMSNQLAIALQKIANQDATFMQNMKSRLTIRAFGSIFVAPFESVRDINITNYLALDDVAQKLNGRVEPSPNNITATFPIAYPNQYAGVKHYIKMNEKSDNDSVVWIDHYLDDKYLTRLIDFATDKDTKSGLFGSKYQWKIHNRYNRLDEKLQRTIQVKRNKGGFL